MITEQVSMKKIPQIMGSSSSLCSIRASAPNAPPRANEPVSPIKTEAGCALYQRKPMQAPTSEAQKIVSSPAPGR